MLATGAQDQLCATDFMARMRINSDQALTFPPITPDILVSDPIDLGADFGIPAVVTPLPSHTEGSLIITIGDLAFVGDLFRGSMISSRAVRHFYICDLVGNQQDMQVLLPKIAPDAETFFPGHFSNVGRAQVVDLANVTPN